MIRVQPFLDDCTATFARTTHGRRACTATESIAIQKYKAPAHRRFFYALCSYGWPWMLTWAIAAVVFLAGCDDLGAHAAVQADLADAVAQARQEAGK
jgi:hypothetical protein